MDRKLAHRFAKGLYLFFVATLLAGLAIMAASPVAQADDPVNRFCTDDGAGGFTCSDLSREARGSWGVTQGDLNGDGNLDVVFAKGLQTNTFCAGDGAGGFTCSDVSPDPSDREGVAQGDLSGDGNLEAISPVRAEPGKGPWVITAIIGYDDGINPPVPGAIYTVDTVTNTLYGPFLQGQLGSAAGGVLDVAVTPNCSTALVSNFGDQTVFFVDVSDPTNPSLLGSVLLPLLAEDIAITSDGRFALVVDGMFGSQVASINIETRTLVETLDISPNGALAVAIAPNRTVLLADYWGGQLHTLTIDGSGHLTQVESHQLPDIEACAGTTYDWPINVAVAPDGQTVLLITAYYDWVSVFRITSPGHLTYVGRVFGIGLVWDQAAECWEGSSQSVDFSCDGSQAYVIINGRRTPDPEDAELPNQITVLDITGPGEVSVNTAGAATLFNYNSGGFYGVDVLAVAGRKLYVGNPTSDEPVNYLHVVNLASYGVTDLPVGQLEGEFPIGVAACPCLVPVPIGGVIVPVNRLELVAPWLGLAALASLAALTVALVRRRRSA